MQKSKSAQITDQLRTAAPLLSFCIPTYNRVGSVLPLVRRLLSTQISEFEIVVSDNGSTDDTVAQLASIDDPRLVIFRNEINRGALFNQVNVLMQGRGSYSALLLDKDSVDPLLIPAFLDFLRREGPSTGYCEYHLPEGSAARIFKQGADALRGVAYSCHHPSGYFFRKKDLHKIAIVERFSDHATVGNFPFEFIQAELALRGPAAIYCEPLFIPESGKSAQAVKSFTINAAKGDAFFSPKGRLKMAVAFSCQILDLPLESQLQWQLVIDRFTHGLRQCTLDFRNVMANRDICEHYHIPPRHVGMPEMLRTAWWFYCQFSTQVLGRTTADMPLSRVVLLIEVVKRFNGSVGRRIRRSFT
jgi:hypothetical protein